MVWDGLPAHRSQVTKEFLRASGTQRIYLAQLPSYAPDLNPDELVWNQMRHVGTSKKPLKKGESLMNRAIMDLARIKRDKKLIRSFFQESTVLFAAA